MVTLLKRKASCILAILTVLAFGIITALGCAKPTKAEAATTTDGTEFPNLWELNLGEREDEVRSLLENSKYYAVIYEGNGRYWYVFDNVNPFKLYNGTNLRVGFSADTDGQRNSASWFVVDADLNLVDYRASSSTNIGWQVAYGGCLVGSNHTLIKYGSTTDAQLQNAPQNNLTLTFEAPPSYSPDAPYARYDVTWGNETKGFEVNSGEYYAYIYWVDAFGWKTYMFLTSSEPFDIYDYSDGTYAISSPSGGTMYKTISKDGGNTYEESSSGFISQNMFGIDHPDAEYVYSNCDIVTRNTGGIVIYSANPLTPAVIHFYDTAIDFSMNVTEVNVSVPLGIACLVNPNEDVTFTYGNLTIVNNSYAPVKISVNVFDVADEGKTMILPDGLTDIGEGLTWNGLNEEQSKTYYSVGVFAEENKNWYEVLADAPGYAGSITTKHPLGVIGARDSATLSLEAHHGFSFKEASALNLRIGFIAELCIE